MAQTGRTMDKMAEQTPEAPMPHNVRPMLATLVDEAFDRKGWIFEIKWDGYRAIAEVGRGRVQLYSRNLLSFNERFPPIVEELPAIGVEAVLDGEVVVVDEDGVSQFQLLQNYLRNREGRLVYYVFDILWLEGHDLTGLPLTKRKEILRKILPPLNYIKYGDYMEEQGTALFRQASDRRLEGIVAKKADSPYRPGIRGRDWLKVRVSLRQEMVIGGWTEPRGGRQYFGALVLGVFDGDEVVYTGHAGTGLDEKGLAYFMSKLEPLERETSPFKVKPKTNEPAHWVDPELVVEVKFTGWTDDGVIRHPVILGLREDKRAKDVRLEKPQTLQSDSSDTSDRSDQQVIEGKTLKLTNLNKVFWPEEGYTKGDVISYYRDIADFILPYLKDRPESLNRFPDGIYGESFYQKNINPDMIPDWIQTVKIWIMGVSATVGPTARPNLQPAITPFEADNNQWSLGANYALAPRWRVNGRFTSSNSEGKTLLDPAIFPGTLSTWTPVDVDSNRWTLGFAYDISAKDRLLLNYSVLDWKDSIDSGQDGRFNIWRLAWSSSF